MKNIYLVSINPPSTIICSPVLVFAKFYNKDNHEYLLRYCPLSKLKYSDLQSYTNSLEIYQDDDKSLSLSLNLTEIKVSPDRVEPLRLLSFSKVGCSAVIFTTTHWISLPINFMKTGLHGQVVASRSFEVKCALQDPILLSCLLINTNGLKRADFTHS